MHVAPVTIELGAMAPLLESAWKTKERCAAIVIIFLLSGKGFVKNVLIEVENMTRINDISNRSFLSLSSNNLTLRPSRQLWKEIRQRGKSYIKVSADLASLALCFELLTSFEDGAKTINCNSPHAVRISFQGLFSQLGMIVPKLGTMRLGVQWAQEDIFVSSLLPVFPHLISKGKKITGLSGILLGGSTTSTKMINRLSLILVFSTCGLIKLGRDTLSRLYSTLHVLIEGKVVDTESSIFVESLEPVIIEGFTKLNARTRYEDI